MWRVVPVEWKPRLRAYLRRKCGQERDRLSAGDFSTRQSVHVHFADGSFALFRHAFAVPDEAGRAVMVFTEHCGYHVFPVGPAEVSVVQTAPLGVEPDAEQDAPAGRPRE
jgi:hypothetical protein